MRINQRKRPFYRRPWLWIVVVILLIGGGWFAIDRSQKQSSQEKTVVKSEKKTAKHKKAKKKTNSDKKKQATSSEKEADSATPPSQNNATASSSANASGQATVPNTNANHNPEPWVDPDNYEPNSIIGDKATMYCYLPGQYPYPGIAPENVVYFNSLAEARAAGYNTVQ